ncbi:hypothetical protein NKH57_32405 [Mesorhizobium sp. M1050]|uniref:hypothetical protein n=1 Tax=Mesorhizobium sp. M1050 TaxID=2957051 RepID=UPI00333D1F10
MIMTFVSILLKRLAFDGVHATRFGFVSTHVVIPKPLHTFGRHALVNRLSQRRSGVDPARPFASSTWTIDRVCWPRDIVSVQGHNRCGFSQSDS